MQQHRRTFLAWAAGATASVLCGSQAGLGQTETPSHDAAPNISGLEEEILDLFSDLPDRKAFKIWAPATENGPEVLVQLNASQRMFVASTMKSVILCERLRQLDSPTVERQIAEHDLALDRAVWSPWKHNFQSA
jgi:hypothetical protein